MSDWYTHEAYQDPPEDLNQGDKDSRRRDKKVIIISYLILAVVALAIIYFAGFGIYCNITSQEAEQGKKACQEIKGQNIPIIFLEPEEVSRVEVCNKFGTLTGRLISYNEFLCPWLN